MILTFGDRYNILTTLIGTALGFSNDKIHIVTSSNAEKSLIIDLFKACLGSAEYKEITPNEFEFSQGSKIIFYSVFNPEGAKGVLRDYLYIVNTELFKQDIINELVRRTKIKTYVDSNFFKLDPLSGLDDQLVISVNHKA